MNETEGILDKHLDGFIWRVCSKLNVMNAMKEYAALKCEEAINNTKEKAIQNYYNDDEQDIDNQIRNIKLSDVMPRFE